MFCAPLVCGFRRVHGKVHPALKLLIAARCTESPPAKPHPTADDFNSCHIGARMMLRNDEENSQPSSDSPNWARHVVQSTTSAGTVLCRRAVRHPKAAVIQ